MKLKLKLKLRQKQKLFPFVVQNIFENITFPSLQDVISLSVKLKYFSYKVSSTNCDLWQFFWSSLNSSILKKHVDLWNHFEFQKQNIRSVMNNNRFWQQCFYDSQVIVITKIILFALLVWQHPFDRYEAENTAAVQMKTNFSCSKENILYHFFFIWKFIKSNLNRYSSANQS